MPIDTLKLSGNLFIYFFYSTNYIYSEQLALLTRPGTTRNGQHIAINVTFSFFSPLMRSQGCLVTMLMSRTKNDKVTVAVNFARTIHMLTDSGARSWEIISKGKVFLLRRWRVPPFAVLSHMSNL